MKYLVGIRPTGKLHVGHYASVIKPARKYNADVLVARYHAPNDDYKYMQRQLGEYGITTKLQNINSELFSKLLAVTPAHLLNAMPQYKTSNKTALMYIYPVLMAHDLVGYDRVIVGDDQRPHIELAKDILPKLGLECPEPIYEGGRIMDLRHPENKMSKSKPNSCLYLKDERNTQKVMRAVTTPEGRANLENIYRLFTNKPIPERNIKLKQQLIELLGREA